MKIRRLLNGFFLGFCLLLAPVGSAKAEPRMAYRYVIPGGSTTDINCPRSNPCDIKHAIENVAQTGDVIYVHSGTYTSSSISEDVLIINKSLTIYGSCSFDALTPVTCDPNLQNSNLDGQTTKRVIRIYGTGVEEVHIEGFTIYRGNGAAMGPCYGSLSGCGGGINATTIQQLTLMNNTLWQNKGGTISGGGGGMFADDINFLWVIGNTFIFNQATVNGLGFGGAALVTNSGGPNAVVFEDNLITGNETSIDFPIEKSGAGLYILKSNNVQITENIFSYQNTIREHENSRGTSVCLDEITGFSIEGNSFTDDLGRSVVYILSNTPNSGSIMRNRWWNNMVLTNLDIFGQVDVKIINNFLGMEVVAPLTRAAATTIIVEGDTCNLIKNNVEILFNTFAAVSTGIQIHHYSDVELQNNIFTEIANPVYQTSTDHVTLLVDNNLYYPASIENGLDANPIFENPKLANVAIGDFHLLPGSGAIDKAYAEDFDVDFDGDPRPIGFSSTPYDVGADEFEKFTYYFSLVQH